jgi:hypothetical protein
MPKPTKGCRAREEEEEFNKKGHNAHLKRMYICINNKGNKYIINQDLRHYGN